MDMAKYNIPFDIAIEYDTYDLKHMKFQDLQRTAAALAREARDRVDTLQRMEGEYGKSPSLSAFERYRNSERYSARYKNRDALMQEISEIKEFLNNETSTEEGFKEWIDRIDDDFGYKSDKTNRDAYFNTYNKLKEYFGNSKRFYSSDQIFEKMKEEAAVDSKYKQNNGMIDWAMVGDELMRRYEEFYQ